ncbi:hypothetical protein HNP55_002862 [Paucibacter oligotrophus]|uniref:Uncharacterized protein n=1 Tax=Roseateles oligotrophus TaxID=1769250 RepID=A0A840L8C3_9BURK|nr:hypothetical protein [Roseateles oligotrophus]
MDRTDIENMTMKLATCNAYCNINTYQGIPVDN